MFLINQAFVDQIILAIREIGQEYRQNQGLILSEEDLRCLLFRKIYEQISDIAVRTNDHGILGSPLHADIPFYDAEGKLRLKPDLTILDPARMSLMHGVSIRFIKGKLAYGKLPEKGFEFFGPTIVIELKFFKSKKGITARGIAIIRSDIAKIRKLERRLNRSTQDNNIRGLVAVFSKVNKYDSAFNELESELEGDKAITLLYCTADFQF